MYTMDQSSSEIERMTEEFESAKLPKDFKREIREEWHFMLWLRQKTYAEIEAITSFERTTIWKDIQTVIAKLSTTPKTVEDVIQTTIMSLRITRAEIMAAAREAQEEKNPRWDRVAKLFGEAADIDKTILTRFTQPALIKQPDVVDSEKSQIILDFIVTKFGPEGLDGFENYYTQQLSIKRKLEATG